MDAAIIQALKAIKEQCIDRFPNKDSKNSKIVLLSYENDDESYAHMLQIQRYLKIFYSNS